MGNETRRKNVMTEISNVYSTSEMFGYRSSRRDKVELADVMTRSRV